MTTAKELLAMIEAVKPDDEAKLRETEKRVLCYINHEDPTRIYWHPALFDHCAAYTKDRNALKAIRPEGWLISISNDHGWHCFLRTNNYSYSVQSPFGLPTEELSELHAIIQAIEWERNNQGEVA